MKLDARLLAVIQAIGADIKALRAAPAGSSPVVTRLLAADVANSTTTGAKVTGLDVTLEPGTYAVEYYVNYWAGATTTGVKFGVNFTGGHGTFAMTSSLATTGTAAISTIHDQGVAPISILGTTATRTKSTTAPNMGPSTGTATANTDKLWRISGLITVTAAGDLQLWHGSEVAAITTVKAGSGLLVTKLG